MTNGHRRVDYDDVAASYDTRYDRNRYSDVRDALLRFVGDARDVIEVGCGTGHWLAELASASRNLVGVDPSRGMLEMAARAASTARLVRAQAENLPLAGGSADRLFCVNAMHHFADKLAFVAEARRVMRACGEILIVGLDPHVGVDQWWVYDYFPSTLSDNLARYPSAAAIRAMLEAVGFVGVATNTAQHFPAAIPFDKALERGYLDRRSTSQLLVISDEEYEAGIRRMTSEQPLVCADLRVYATVGRLGNQTSALPL
jgi:ubiquinone/menaquinone biosynthesis C-methylase UbiE